MFITFEGINGSGKTTQSRKLFEYLNDKIKLVIPDITFLIDIPVSVSESRLAPLVYEAIIKGEGYKKYDEIETSNMQKIVDSYRKIATNNSDRVKIIDGTLDKNEIHKKIVSIVSSYF